MDFRVTQCSNKHQSQWAFRWWPWTCLLLMHFASRSQPPGFIHRNGASIKQFLQQIASLVGLSDVFHLLYSLPWCVLRSLQISGKLLRPAGIDMQSKKLNTVEKWNTISVIEDVRASLASIRSLAQTLSDTITWQQRCLSIRILKRYRCLVGWAASMMPWARSRDASAMVRRCCMQLGMPQLPQREKTQHARMQLQETLWRHCAALFSKHGRFVGTPNKVDRPVWSFRRMAGCGSTFESRKLWKWTQPHLQRIHVKMECPQNRLQETQHAVDLMWVCFARGTNESGRCVIICCRKWANEDFGSMHSG